jgi:hypothetical protein
VTEELAERREVEVAARHDDGLNVCTPYVYPVIKESCSCPKVCGRALSLCYP